MRIGIHTAQLGRLADPAAVRSAALCAEHLGYATLWVRDRFPAAVAARRGEAGRPGAPGAAEPGVVLDPLTVLTASAAVTSRIRLGTSVLVAPWYRPALLARSLASLDVLSDGRLTLGLGLGWPVDEHEAGAEDPHQLGRRLDGLLDVLEAHWTEGPGVHDGPEAAFAPAPDGLRPRQRPRPPILLSASTPAGLDRVARRADGWDPALVGPDAVAPMWTTVRDLAAGYGRDPDRLQLVVRADIGLVDRPLEGERPPFHGSLDQVIDDVLGTRAIGAHEVILDVGGDRGLDEALDAYARIAEAVGLPAAEPAADRPR